MNSDTRLSAFSPRHVQARLRAALRRNDRRSLAVRAHGYLHPSDFEDEVVAEHISRHGFRVLPVISDGSDAEGAELQRAACQFAKLYNDELMAQFLRLEKR